MKLERRLFVLLTKYAVIIREFHGPDVRGPDLLKFSSVQDVAFHFST